MFNVVGIVSRPDRREALELASKSFTHLKNKGLTVFLEPKLAKKINKTEFSKPIEKMNVEMIVTIGGDGTILRTCLLLPNPEPHILAINMGVRGFLTEVSPKETLTALDKCLEGKFELEQYHKISSSICDLRQPDALNEVFITSREVTKVLYIKIFKDNELIARCQSDGVVIASQVGSTGYSLSGGGPILDPEVDAFVLTPICPLTVFHPIVLPTDSTIKVELIKPKTATIVIDGHYRTTVESKKDYIVIKKSEYTSSFIRLKSNFYHRLKRRLLFIRGNEI